MLLQFIKAVLICQVSVLAISGISFASDRAYSRYLDVTSFSSPSEIFFSTWKMQTFAESKETLYTLVKDDRSGSVLQAEADASVSWLVREITINPAEFPLIVWSWKVSDVVDQAVLSDKMRDDAPVRLMISFGTDFLKGGKPKGSLCYVWSTEEPEGSFIVNPYIDNVMAVVVASGRENIGTWQFYRRNLVRDYHRAFGEPPGEIRAVTIISDTDNTSGKIRAWYGAIGLASEAAD